MTNAGSSTMSIEDTIRHYQRSIEKSQNDSKRILHCIGKLHRMDVTVQHLQATGIGRTVNALRKDDGDVGIAAKALISKWKQMVAAESSGCSEDEKCEEESEAHDNEDIQQANLTNRLAAKHYSDGKYSDYNTEHNSERKSHKLAEHASSSSSNSRHESRLTSKSSENHHKTHHSSKRKYSSDEQEQHKLKLHSNDDERAQRRREKEIQKNGRPTDEREEHHKSSKHSKSDRHRSHTDAPHESEQIEKKHKSNREHHSKMSDQKVDSTSTEKSHHHSSSSKHKRSRDTEDPMERTHDKPSSVKRQKCDTTTSSTSSSRKEEKKSSKSKPKPVDDGIEIDHSMGTSFADALGMLEPMPAKGSTSSPTKGSSKSSSSQSSSKDKASCSSGKSKHKEKHKSSSSASTSSAPPSLLTSKVKLPPLDDISKDLPPPAEYVIPNDYKPMPVNALVMDCVFRQPKQPAYMLNEADALCASTTSKNQRTKVYSGVKSGTLLTVPSLHELCIRFLQKNIDALEFTGGVPFEILKPVLERASPEQLYTFEHYNPYLMDDSDILWQQHCNRRFKRQQRQEMETWREMYFRCINEQEERLNSLTNNIKKSQSVAIPVRQTKLAYVDSLVKPPRNVVKKQIQYGTSNRLVATPAARVEALSAAAPNAARSGDVRLKTLAALRDTAQAQPSNGSIKSRKAPLMAKTLQLMKGRFKR